MIRGAQKADLGNFNRMMMSLSSVEDSTNKTGIQTPLSPTSNTEIGNAGDISHIGMNPEAVKFWCWIDQASDEENPQTSATPVDIDTPTLGNPFVETLYKFLLIAADHSRQHTGFGTSITEQLVSLISKRKPYTVTNELYVSFSFVIQLRNATARENIFGILDQTGHKEIAERLRYLHDVTPDNDPEDPDMELDSLRELALFLIRDDVSLPLPEIGITADGTLQLEWYLSHASALMNFLPDGNIQFAGISTMENNDEEQSIHGTGSKKFALKSILPFISQ
jgi:hypothetical protein